MVYFTRAHLSATDRSQLLLPREAVDDYVEPDNPVRFIETFVDGPDLQAAGFVRVVSLKWLGPLHPIARRADNAASRGHCERMKLREFVAGDWSWLQEWFKDKLLNRELGPMDAEWLEAVVAERNGVR
ncbi:hypothetical protein [Brucella pituitosa]